MERYPAVPAGLFSVAPGGALSPINIYCDRLFDVTRQACRLEKEMFDQEQSEYTAKPV
jgi:hypothetical protein